jgi:hypothetical protein
MSLMFSEPYSRLTSINFQKYFTISDYSELINVYGTGSTKLQAPTLTSELEGND